MFGISLHEFENLCKKGDRYTGYVDGLGYVFWNEKHIVYEETNPNSFPSTNRYVNDFYELVVVKDAENAERGLRPLNNLKDVGVNALSIYGIANSIEQLSTKKVIVGAEYIQINSQGTLMRNPNRIYTTKGELATKVGRKILGVGIVVDLGLAAIGEQTWSQAGINIGVNVGIYLVGSACPPLGIVLGIAWFIHSVAHSEPRITHVNYEELHGSITPPDATRVSIPQYYPPQKVVPQKIGVQKQYYYEQGK